MNIKQVINSTVFFSGYEFKKKDTKETIKRSSPVDLLRHISKFWQPKAVIDVGAAFGSWTKEAYSVFSGARYYLIEPLPHFQPALEKVLKEIKKSQLIQKAASQKSGKITFNIHDDLVGSSIKKETEGYGVDGQEITVDSTTIDELSKKYKIQDNILLKIDTQGAELDVLDGANNTLENVECLIVEVSFFRAFVNGPAFYEVVDYLHQKGFVVYDIGEFLYRPYDGALSQTDIVFVKEKSVFRKYHGYATEEQRKAQNERFRNKLKEKFSINL